MPGSYLTMPSNSLRIMYNLEKHLNIKVVERMAHQCRGLLERILSGTQTGQEQIGVGSGVFGAKTNIFTALGGQPALGFPGRRIGNRPMYNRNKDCKSRFQSCQTVWQQSNLLSLLKLNPKLSEQKLADIAPQISSNQKSRWAVSVEVA